jgi:hypothetical protein
MDGKEAVDFQPVYSGRTFGIGEYFCQEDTNAAAGKLKGL